MLPPSPKIGRFAPVKIEEFLGRKAEASAEERTGKVRAGVPRGHHFCTFNPEAKHCSAHRALQGPPRASLPDVQVCKSLEEPLEHQPGMASCPPSLNPSLPPTPPTLPASPNLHGATVVTSLPARTPIPGDEGARAFPNPWVLLRDAGRGLSP